MSPSSQGALPHMVLSSASCHSLCLVGPQAFKACLLLSCAIRAPTLRVPMCSLAERSVSPCPISAPPNFRGWSCPGRATLQNQLALNWPREVLLRLSVLLEFFHQISD